MNKEQSADDPSVDPDSCKKYVAAHFYELHSLCNCMYRT